MAKKQKVVAVVAEVVAPVVAEKPLTKRTRTATSAVLEASGKAVNVRTKHTVWTWEVLAKILPATAAECVKALTDAEAEPGVKEKCGGLNSHVNYYVRRGWLKVAE